MYLWTIKDDKKEIFIFKELTDKDFERKKNSILFYLIVIL